MVCRIRLLPAQLLWEKMAVLVQSASRRVTDYDSVLVTSVSADGSHVTDMALIFCQSLGEFVLCFVDDDLPLP